MPEREIEHIKTHKKSLSDQVAKLFHREEMQTVTYDEMKLLRYFQSLPLDTEGKVQSYRIPFNGSSIYFRVEFEKGGVLTLHDHDCKEWVWCETGLVYDPKSRIEMGRMQRQVFNAGVPHILEAKEDSIVYVEFEKPLL